jgi:adenine phosphoribosyltransferase
MHERASALIRDVPDFPKKGIVFKDITPLLMNIEVLHEVAGLMAEPFAQSAITKVLGIEARGFVFGTLVAKELGVGLVLARKPGKLPRSTMKVEYDLEYGTDGIEVHRDDLTRDDNVLIVDDVLATGGTARAAAQVVRDLEAELAGWSFLGELTFLSGRDKLAGAPISSLLQWD